MARSSLLCPRRHSSRLFWNKKTKPAYHQGGWDVEIKRGRNQWTKRYEHGGAGVEYALLLMVAAMVLVGVMASVETSIGDLWNSAAAQISAVLGSG